MDLFAAAAEHDRAFRGVQRNLWPQQQAVSYTHLDVYKRQVLHDLLRGSLAVVDLQYTEYLFLLFRCGYSGFGGGVLLGQSIKNCIGLMMSVQNLPEKDQIFSVFRVENA